MYPVYNTLTEARQHNCSPWALACPAADNKRKRMLQVFFLRCKPAYKLRLRLAVIMLKCIRLNQIYIFVSLCAHRMTGQSQKMGGVQTSRAPQVQGLGLNTLCTQAGKRREWCAPAQACLKQLCIELVSLHTHHTCARAHARKHHEP